MPLYGQLIVLLVRCIRPFMWLCSYIGIDAQTERQALARVELDEGLEDFGIHALAGLVGTHVLFAENATYTNDATGEYS